MRHFKIIIEKHLDGYIAYPIGVMGAIVDQGNTYEEALSKIWVENPVLLARLWITIKMVEIPKVGGCEAAFSRHPRT